MNAQRKTDKQQGVSHPISLDIPADMAAEIEAICEREGWTFDEFLTRAAKSELEKSAQSFSLGVSHQKKAS